MELISQDVSSRYHNTERKDDPIRVIERKQARGESRRSDEERNEKENGATQCSRGRWGGGPFVGHTLGPPWRLIACNALLTCLASSYRQRRVARKTRVVQQQNPDDPSRGRGAMSGTLGPTRRGRRGWRGWRRPPVRRSPRAIATGDGVASFPLSSRCRSLECHRHLLTAKMKTCSSPCLTAYWMGEILSTTDSIVSQKNKNAIRKYLETYRRWRKYLYQIDKLL